MEWRQAAVILIVGALAAEMAFFTIAAYTEPGRMPLPAHMVGDYMTEHSAGFGLREAMESLPAIVPIEDTPVIASMFPPSCRRANMYAPTGYELQCVQSAGADVILAALAERGRVYVLVEEPPIGVDVEALGVHAVRVGAYPRPGEDETNASVVLWLLETGRPGE